MANISLGSDMSDLPTWKTNSDFNITFLWNWHYQNDSVFDKIFVKIGARVCYRYSYAYI